MKITKIFILFFLLFTPLIHAVEFEADPNFAFDRYAQEIKKEGIQDPALIKLLAGIKTIQNAPKTYLRTVDYLVKIVRRVGFAWDARGFELYGKDVTWMNPTNYGLYQNSRQISECLIYLSFCEIHSFIEIGTWTGWTSAIMTAYLQRFNPDLQTTCVDIANFYDHYPAVKKVLPIKFMVGKTSEDFRGQYYDLAFIDADHSFEGSSKDWDNVGQFAKIAMFHDVNCRHVRGHPGFNGGCARLWDELKLQEILNPHNKNFLEFFWDSEYRPIMGIGLIVDRNMFD